MKNLSLTVVLLFMSVISFAQQKDESVNTVPVPIIYSGTTGRLDQYVAPAGTVNEITKTDNLQPGYIPKQDWVRNENPNPADLMDSPDAAHQKDYPPAAPPTKALINNWDGIGFTGVNPADPSVDVGPNHVVQMINGSSGARIQVYNKTGTAIGAEVYFDNFMGMPGGSGDPIVMYDERADRWFLSEFSQSGNNLHIAISQTADPGGAYYTYIFNSPGGFPDYPKYSIWENEYVMTANVNVPDVYAFNRADLLTGTATPAQMFNQTNFGTIGFQASTPVSMNGTTLPPSGQPALLMRMRDNSWAGAATDALEMWELSIDWVTPANSALTQVQTLGITPHESELCGYTSFSCFDQPGGGSADLDPLRELLMNRIHYRNFGTHESIVCCHVTDVDGTDRGGVRWYELRRTGGTAGTWSIYQESTYSPDTDNRWMASIGISASGNIGLAYSVSSTTTYPSLRYTGRRECDPLNTMTEPETVIIAGTASNASIRWGDYFQMGCDPTSGETFYFTGCYNTSANWSTRIGSFDIPICVTTPEVIFDNPVNVTVDEGSSTTPNGCLDYQVVNVPMSIGIAPSADADITVTVSGGTATNGVDYVLNNVSFTLNGASLTGNAEIWIYNDDYVEGAETIILSYTLNNNGGNAVAGAVNQTFTLTINDDDVAPTAAESSTLITVFQYDFESGLAPFTTTNNGTPADTPWQVGNNAAASTAAYAIPVSNTTNFAWVNDDACNCDQNDVDLDFPTVDLSGVLSATLTFDTYFEDNTYNGDNENADLYVSTGGLYTLIGPLTASVIDSAWITQNFDISAYAGNSNVDFRIKYSDATGWLYGCTVDDVLITGFPPIGIQTPINTGAGHIANLGPNETVHYYDPATGDVMLSLVNTSAFDYGCVTVEVDRPGTTPGAVQFNTANTADYLHTKTYTIVPTNTNPSGAYDVTVYYEEAEVVAWETATGNSRANAEVVKVDGNNQISDVTPGTAASYTISSSPATVGTFYSDVTFTSSFTTGFSGFGVGIYNPNPGTAPVANFSATPTTICENSSVSFTDLSTNTPTSWSWNFGDGSPLSTAQNPMHTYTNAGLYTVTLTATNASGSDVSTQVNYITVNAIPAVLASGVTTICAGQSTTITGSGATTYSWDNGLGAGASQIVTPATTTTYTVTGAVSGCSASDAVTVTVNPLPTITTGTVTNPSACATATGSIVVNGSGTGALSWIGAASGSITGVTLPYTITGLAVGTYNISYVDGNGCSSNTLTETLVDPGGPAVIATGATAICAGGSTSITATGATTYSWDNGLGAGATQSVSPATTTTYTVTGTTAGCANTATVTVTVNPLPTITVGTVSDPTSCGTATGSIVVNGSGTGDVTWTGTASGSATGVTLPYTVSGIAAGPYSITYVDGNGCTSNTIGQTLTDPGTPSVVASGAATICAGQSTTISGSGATSYTWDNGLGVGATQTVSPTVTTTYTVTGSNTGCAGTDAVTITVTPGPTVVATGSSSICAGQSASISATGAIAYSWDNGLGAGASQTVSPVVTTTYTVTGTSAGCTNTDAVTITVNPVPTVVATGATTVCAGQSGTILGSGATTYSWDNGLGTNPTQTVTPLITTVYTVTGTTSGCSSSATVTINVNTLPSITVASATNPSSCGSATGSIAISGSGTGNITWVGPTTGNAIAVPMPYTITGLMAGSYSITYVDGNGCTSNTLVQLLNDPGSPSVVALGTATICAGESTTINGTGAVTYSWDNGLGAGGSQTVSPATTTTYTVTGTTAGCVGMDVVTITVNPTSSSAQSFDICEGSSVTVGSNTYSTSGTYTDVFVNSVGCDSIVTTTVLVNPSPTVSMNPSTIDTMCLSTAQQITLVGNPAGGTFSGTGVSGGFFFPSIAGAGSHTITYSYTDANGCIVETDVIAVIQDCAGIAENALDGVSLFPNPNDGMFALSGLAIGTEYSIYDDRGRLVAKGITESVNQEVTLQGAEAGIYYLYSAVNGKRGSIKFLIAN
ncbi:MAG: PKD domain-containing protein [Crocinitomicaceae bacterium]|nr:PKD domain-containing protein [Crocinitomicaceae bacterium]